MGSAYTYDTTNSRFAEDPGGAQLRKKPRLYYKNLTTWTLSFKTNDGNGNLSADTRFASLASFNFAVDNDSIHTLRGNLNGALTGAITSVTISNITLTPPATGEIVLLNSAGETETIAYTAVSASGSDYIFTVSTTLTYSYADNDSADVKEELMVKVDNSDIDSSGKATGVFVITIDSNKRGYLLATLDSASAENPRLEFKGYDGSGNIVETFQAEIECLNLIDDDGVAAPAQASDYYTKAQSDARYILMDGTETYIDLQAGDGSTVRLAIELISGTDYKITLTKQ